MTTQRPRKIVVITVSMIIVVTTFGLANVIDTLVEPGLSALPSWVIVGVLYFLPMALILAEFASDTRKARGLGPASWPISSIFSLPSAAGRDVCRSSAGDFSKALQRA